MARIYTIGHSTRPVQELIALLRAQGVECLVDVRRFPGSRRQPQYGREALAGSLAEAGIGYLHEGDLGGRRPARPDSRNGHWRESGFRGYADYLATPEFEAALGRLRALCSERSCAIMCAEAVPWRCHRQLIADALVAGGDEVRHILGPGEARVHVLNPAARRDDAGVLYYPGEQLALEEGGNGGDGA